MSGGGGRNGRAAGGSWVWRWLWDERESGGLGPVWHCCAVKIIAVRFAVRGISYERKQFGVW
ncbi:unnamed protein product [Prunus armeniaca]